MIRIEIRENGDGRIAGFSVEGHSGTAASGEDVVCAGVSAVTETALLGIGKYLDRDVDYRIKKGSLFVQLNDEPDDLTEAILRTMFMGLIEIEKLCPAAVKVKISR